MKIFNILWIALIATLFSCNKKVNNVDNVTSNDTVNIIKKVDYVMNANLLLTNYSEYEGYLPEEGLIPTAEVAFQVAEPILSNLFGKEHIESEKPFSINLDKDVWIIEGTSSYRKGGVAYMEIRKSNGEILKVIHGK